jgi:pantoate--beta-alanine ligase
MLIFKRVDDLQKQLNAMRSQGKSIGFVPTMGALHPGHLSLIRKSVQQNDCTVCSIFVNPAQFNDAADLEKYPRPMGQDLQLCAMMACDIVFIPEVGDMYPPGLLAFAPIELNGLDRELEGSFRPGHFAGMLKAVERLLSIVNPDQLYMGQKDYQQALLVSRLIEFRALETRLHICPTGRAEDGLALSSRNVRLSSKARAMAPLLYKALQKCRRKLLSMGKVNLESADLAAKAALSELPSRYFKTEYFEVRKASDLSALSGRSLNASSLVIITAVWLNGVRLIDNVLISD